MSLGYDGLRDGVLQLAVPAVPYHQHNQRSVEARVPYPVQQVTVLREVVCTQDIPEQYACAA